VSEVSHNLPDVSENEGPPPTGGGWLVGAYRPADGVAAEPVPTTADNATADNATADDATADDVTRSSDVAEDDPAAVTTMFAVITEETSGATDTTTSFAAVEPLAHNPVAAPATTVTGTGTPRRQRSRAVLVAVAGATVVVVLGVAAAAAATAFGGVRGKATVPPPVPVSSAPAEPPATPMSTTGPAKAFPRYLGKRSPVRGRITDRTVGLSYSRLGGKWRYGKDGRGLSVALGVGRKGPQLKGIMEAGTAEYLSAPLPVALGRSATAAAAQAVASDVIRAGQTRAPVVLSYAPERLTGVKGWLAGFQVQGGPADGEVVAVAVVDAGAARPGILYVTVPKAEAAVRPDIRALAQSLRIAR
jgi:hypothetical protein